MNTLQITAPMNSNVVSVTAKVGDKVKARQLLVILEAMKVQSAIVAPQNGVVTNVKVRQGDMVNLEQVLLEIEAFAQESSETASAENQISKSSISETPIDESQPEPIQELIQRKNQTQDDARQHFMKKRLAKGYRSARQNLADLCCESSFMEYGQLAVAAQRQRRDYQELQTSTAADGVITGVGLVNADFFTKEIASTALIINDYSVLAGTQGYYHHQKIDRMIEVIAKQKLPAIMYTEGGGGRPGDTDITTVNSGLQCTSFSNWAALSGLVPRISVANGYCFAGNAALFGAADITIATKTSWIGMAGPAMIEGGGLGTFKPTDIGPIETQSKNGVVDIVCDDEEHATHIAKKCLSYFQGSLREYQCPEQKPLNQLLPPDRRFVYKIRTAIEIIADVDSFTELKSLFGGAIVTGFMRVEGKPVGILASDCKVNGGAIDVDAGEKATDFIQLCNQFRLPMVVLCDTPGFMVGPNHEELGAVRRLGRMFTAGAKIDVPLVAVVLRKCYGLGAQALLGGHTAKPTYTLAWPNGEFGPMGLEGAVKLGFKKELEAQTDPKKRQELFDNLLAQQYQRGRAIEVASVLEIDAVIAPEDTRSCIVNMLMGMQ